MFPEHVEKAFWTPNVASSQFNEYSQLGSRRKVRPVKNQLGSNEYFQLGSRTNIRPVKNGLKGQRSGSDVTNRQATKRGSRVCVSVHRATDLDKFPVRISSDEAPFQ